MHWESDVFVFARDYLDGPAVAADSDDLLRGEPLCRRVGDARLAAIVGCVLSRILLEQVTPTGVDEHRIPFAQRHVVHLEPGLQVSLGDHRARVETGAPAS